MRINLVVIGESQNQTIPWKVCEDQSSQTVSDSSKVKYLCPDLLVNPAVPSLVAPNKEMFFVEMVACDSNHEQFKGMECGTFEDSRDYL